MFKVELQNHDVYGDPAPSFPYDAEIAFAEQLRHQLEVRYLLPSMPSSPFEERSSEGPRFDPLSTACGVTQEGDDSSELLELETRPSRKAPR